MPRCAAPQVSVVVVHSRVPVAGIDLSTQSCVRQPSDEAIRQNLFSLPTWIYKKLCARTQKGKGSLYILVHRGVRKRVFTLTLCHCKTDEIAENILLNSSSIQLHQKILLVA